MNNSTDERASFIFHRDWYSSISKRSAQTRLEIYDAIMEKVFNGKESELSEVASVVMDFISPQIERDTEKWIDIKRKRSVAGAKHSGNQYIKKLEQNGTNGTSVPTMEQNGTNGTVCVSVSDNVDNNIVILKEKEDNKLSPKKKVLRFVKPTIEQINAYIIEKHYHVDAENFFNFYESKGWVVGKSPMKDWKAAVRTWETKYLDNHPSEQNDLFARLDNTNSSPYPQGYWQ